MKRSTSWGCKKKKLVSYKIKRDVLKNKCYICGNDIVRPSLDHVVPVSRGGINKWANILWACLSCNTSKCARKARPCELLLLNAVNDLAAKVDNRIPLNDMWTISKVDWLYKKSLKIRTKIMIQRLIRQIGYWLGHRPFKDMYFKGYSIDAFDPKISVNEVWQHRSIVEKYIPTRYGNHV